VVVVGLYDIVSHEEVGANLLMVSAVVIIPMVILFTLVRRYLTEVPTGGPPKADLLGMKDESEDVVPVGNSPWLLLSFSL
jgi:hypothetical protein